MSETETEQGEEGEEEAAAETTEPTPEEEEEGEAEAEAADEQPQAAGLTEKELEQRFDRLHRENERHAKRIGEILEEDANDLLLCPLCSPFIHGFILNAPVADEPREATLGLLGVESTEDLREASYLEECAECGGPGRILTHSKRGSYRVANCERCQGTGYTRTGAAPSNGQVMAPDYLAPPEHVVPPPPADLAEVERLRLAGYTVVPPMHIQP